MKNIHIISTPNPSRLWLTKLGNLTRCHDIKPIKEALGNNVNIYITSDKEIKEGDWFLSKEGIVHNNWGWNFGDKKIILTTDQDLIKDGVQAIDDEFLQWFVKNPSCEEVKIELKTKQLIKPYDVYNESVSYYKIIIPKEEPTEEAKQRAANYMSLKGALEPKQIKCYCGHTTYCDCSPLEEPKQETLEEAAKKYCLINNISTDQMIVKNDRSCEFETPITMFIAGAKWQAERSYSEEEVFKLLNNFNKHTLTLQKLKLGNSFNVKEWFEQFKKK